MCHFALKKCLGFLSQKKAMSEISMFFYLKPKEDCAVL